ncbi:MAG: hypothetical protein JKY65_04600 [Planctomycetes bacterium]|nr:hypothetical protein [Planctomycetota bacterium]
MSDKKLRKLEAAWLASGSRLDRAAYVREHLRVVSVDGSETAALLKSLLKGKDAGEFSAQQLVLRAGRSSKQDQHLEGATLYEAAAARAEGERRYWCAARAGFAFLRAGSFGRARNHFDSVVDLDWKKARLDFDWKASEDGYAGTLELLEALDDAEGFRRVFLAAVALHEKEGWGFPQNPNNQDRLLECCDRLELGDLLTIVVDRAAKRRPTERALKKRIAKLTTPHEGKPAKKSKPKSIVGPLRSADFRKLVTRHFAPKIRTLGWTGSGFHYRFQHSEFPLLFLLGFRGFSGGETFVVEYGFYPLISYTNEGRPQDPKKLKVANCWFSKGLPSERRFGASESEGLSSAEACWKDFSAIALGDLESAGLLYSNLSQFKVLKRGAIKTPKSFAFSRGLENPTGPFFELLAEIARSQGDSAKTEEFCRGGLAWAEGLEHWKGRFEPILEA